MKVINLMKIKHVAYTALTMGLIATTHTAVAVDVNAITGAGASFPAPLYSKWASDYHKATQVKINYQSVGSSAGLKQIEAKTVDFGASDMPLKDDVLKEKGLIQFPTVIGGVVPIVNLKDIPIGQLKLTGKVLADIYLGKITHWNASEIKELNPDLNLPNAAIIPVRRADGSGTSFIFTNYLSKVNPDWKSKIGEGSTVNWVTGLGGKGNEGVASFVNRLPNSIGYLEYAYVKQNKLNYVQMENTEGVFVKPDDETFKAAAANADWSKTFYQILTNQKGKNSWPLTGATFVLMQVKQANPAKTTHVLKFFDWGYTQGGKITADLDYVNLPETAKKHIYAAWGQIVDNTGKSINMK